MKPISAVIITLNEASNIAACIQALQKVAAEILVIDSGSTDGTVALARQLGAKVIESKWQGYAATKNYGNKLASHNWILSIDADEVVSETLAENINALPLDPRHVYSLDRLTNYCGQWIRHSGWYPEWKTRLFHRDSANWEGAFVHEQLKHANSLAVKKLNGKLYHYSYKTYDEHLERIQKYALLSAQAMQAKGQQSTLLKCWGSPILRFFKTLILKTAFLDGKNGWIISIRNAKLVHWKYKYLRDLNKTLQSL